MKTKTFYLALLLSITLFSCSSANAFTPSATSTSTIFWISNLTAQELITPQVITPFPLNNSTDNISSIIIQVYWIKPECIHPILIDDPSTKTKVKIRDVAEPNNLNVEWVQAVTIAPNESRQAYVACVTDSTVSQGCSYHVYVKDEPSAKVFEIKFDGQLLARPASNIVWVGNDVLVFRDHPSQHQDTYFAIDINKKENIYYSTHNLQCK